MMKQLKYFVLALLLCGLSPMAAQAQDAKAKSILTAVSNKIKGLQAMKANFSLKMLNAAGKAMQTHSGTFTMKGNKYRISLGSQEIFCDGRTVWTYMKDANEVQITAYNPSEQSTSPQHLFSGGYEKDYTYHYAGARTVGGKSVDVIALTPKAAGQFNKVELTVDKGNNITGGTLFQKNGAKTQYTISGIQTNPAVSDATFVFDAKKYPGVEVVDLR